MRVATAILALALCSCSTMQIEPAWQATHALDIAQTYHGVGMDSRCYYEADPVTSRITGTHPSQGGILAWGIGYAGLHYVVSRWLDGHAPRWVALTWSWVSLADNVYANVHNYQVGIRIGAPNAPCGAEQPRRRITPRNPGDAQT